jgi:hypothetical protein
VSVLHPRPAGVAYPRDLLAGVPLLWGIIGSSAGFWFLYTQFTFTFALYAHPFVGSAGVPACCSY